MERSKVILLGLLMAILGAIAPVSLMAWLSSHTALSNEEQRLHGLAEQVLDRTNLSIFQAAEALKSLTPLNLAPCSPDHIALMRLLIVNTPAMQEIGYFENGMLKCTSWGPVDQAIPEDKPDFTIWDGVGITTMMIPLISGGDPVLAVHYGRHNALMNRSQFTDLMVDRDVRLALARTGGLVVAESGSPDIGLVQALADGKPVAADSPFLHAGASRDGWTAVAMEDRSGMLDTVHRQQLWMLPIGAFISLFIVLLVVRLSRKRLSPVSELKTAIRKREFVVHYQPIIALAGGRCIGAEALVRWRRPDGKLVRPDLFIPLAEESGLILPITDLVIESVVRELKDLLLAERNMHVAINLCAEDIRSGRVLPILAAALKAGGVPPEQIWLEATERGFMDITSARVTLAKARAMGHSTAIDDFGTGYSSLQYLQGLPMDALKIDKSFVSTIGTGSVSSSVIAHIIEMAKSLNLSIVAEGVEHQHQADYLAERGVDFVQGWLYAKAMPAADFIAYLRNCPTSAMPANAGADAAAVEP